MSLELFNVYIRNLENEMRKVQTGGTVIYKEKKWNIMYADDVALIAETEGELKEMIRRLRRYLEKKKLILSAEKSKVMVFEKSKRKEKREWMLKDKKIEEVKK